MKTFSLSVAITALFLISSSVFAGNRAGNGGGAWVCRDLRENIRWAKSVDLFEAEADHKQILRGGSRLDYRLLAREALNRISRVSNIPMKVLIPYIRKVNNLREGARTKNARGPLKFINDALFFSRPGPESCPHGNVRYAQVVNYRRDRILLVDRTIFNALPANAKAALIVHEVIYAYRRSLGDHDSLNSRRMVGLAFSNLSDSVLTWAFKFLETADAPVFPGRYSIRTVRVNDDSTITPLRKVTVSLTGNFGPHSARAELVAVSNDAGLTEFDLDHDGGFFFEAPLLRLTFADRHSYRGFIAPNGWASALSPTGGIFGNDCPYSCMATSMLGESEITVVCVDRPRP